jgi:hypothetical protein
MVGVDDHPPLHHPVHEVLAERRQAERVAVRGLAARRQPLAAAGDRVAILRLGRCGEQTGDDECDP